MGKYFLLQLKRVAKALPYGVCVVLVLFVCLSAVFNALLSAEDDQPDLAKVSVGIVGTANDEYLQWGMAAIQFDSSMLSIKVKPMDEREAAEALEKGDVSAYIVFPEGFTENAITGDVQKLRFVSTAGATGMVSILKEEVTKIVDTILVACENGSYGVGEALSENGLGRLWSEHVNSLSMEYVDFLFDRSKMYEVETITIQQGTPLDRYMLGGLTVLLLMLACLPFAHLFVVSDYSLHKVMRAKRISVLAQVACEFAAFLAGIILLMIIILAVLSFGGLLPEGVSFVKIFLQCCPSALLIAAFAYFVYCTGENLLGGVLFFFFSVFALCFVGGCIYPIYFFPKGLQAFSAYLPTSMMRSSLTSCFMGEKAAFLMPICAFAVAFLAGAVILRWAKIGKIKG